LTELVPSYPKATYLPKAVLYPGWLQPILGVLLLGGFLCIPAHGQAPGFALRFDGSTDYVFLSETANMMGTGWEDNKTISLWVRPQGAAEAGVDPVHCNAIFGDRPRWWGISRGIIGVDDKIWIWNYDGNFDSIAIDYAVDEWVHLAMVHSGGILRAFKNGIEVGSTTSGSTLQPSTGALPMLQIGGIINSATRNWTFRGEIDEVSIWSRGRTAEEILRDFNVILLGTETGLDAYYRMSDGAGGSLNDDSVNNWIGTLSDGGPGVPPDGDSALWVPSSAPVTNPPTADPQTVITAEDTAVRITLIATDPDGDPLSYFVVSGPTNGVLSGMAPDLNYNPDGDFNGTDSFRFRVNDGLVDSLEVGVTITVTSANDDPVAVDDTAVTAEGVEVTVPVLNNDSDVDGDILIVTDVGIVANGTVVNLGDSVICTPDAGFIGTETFSYTISDGNGGTDSAQVEITVTNDPIREETGFVITPGSAWAVTVVNSRAYVADVGGGLRIVDVSDPYSPAEIGFHDTPGRTYAVEVLDNYAYLADGRDGLRIIDVSDPTAPFEVGLVDTPMFAWGLAIDYPHIYVTDRWGGLRVIDASVRTSPIEIGFVDTPRQALGVVLNGDIAYVADFGGGLRVIDISVPSAPIEVDALEIGYTFGLAAEDGYLYVAGGEEGLLVFDVSIPISPVEVGSSATTGLARSLALMEGYAFVTGDLAGIHIIDVIDPTDPIWTATIDTPGRALSVATDTGFAYVADHEGGLRVIRIF